MATTKKADGEAKKPAISYWSKDKCQCPVCKKFFEREIMRRGTGRMIAGGLSEDLHRTFEPRQYDRQEDYQYLHLPYQP